MDIIDIEDKTFRIWSLLHQCSELCVKSREYELTEYGITIMQSAVMGSIIKSKRPLKIVEICRRLKREPHTITVLVKRMIKHGLLEEIARTKASGGKTYKITNKGLAAYNHSRTSENINTILSVLSEEEKEMIFNIWYL